MIDLMPNQTVLVQWVVFAIAVTTLHFGIFRPTLRILERRRAKTLGEREKSAELDRKSQEMLAFCEEKVAEATRIGQSRKEERREAAEKVSEDLLKRTRSEMEEKMEEVRSSIECQAKAASLQLRQYAQDMSRDIAVKILEREV